MKPRWRSERQRSLPVPSGSITSSSTAFGLVTRHVRHRAARGVDPFDREAGGAEAAVQQGADIGIVLHHETFRSVFARHHIAGQSIIAGILTPAAPPGK